MAGSANGEISIVMTILQGGGGLCCIVFIFGFISYVNFFLDFEGKIKELFLQTV